MTPEKCKISALLHVKNKLLQNAYIFSFQALAKGEKAIIVFQEDTPYQKFWYTHCAHVFMGLLVHCGRRTQFAMIFIQLLWGNLGP